MRARVRACARAYCLSDVQEENLRLVRLILTRLSWNLFCWVHGLLARSWLCRSRRVFWCTKQRKCELSHPHAGRFDFCDDAGGYSMFASATNLTCSDSSEASRSVMLSSLYISKVFVLNNRGLTFEDVTGLVPRLGIVAVLQTACAVRQRSSPVLFMEVRVTTVYPTHCAMLSLNVKLNSCTVPWLALHPVVICCCG